MEKTVSIIIPVYNVERYLPICLNSVESQTCQALEIILVDDGSTDKSGAICDEYQRKDRRIRVIHKGNGGVSSARNYGIEAATGEYICFADADDILEKDYVEYLLNLLECAEADISVTTSFFTTFGGRQNKQEIRRTVIGEDAAKQILYYHIPIGCYCKMFRRSFLNDHSVRFMEDVYIGEGFNFNVQAFMAAGKVAIGNRKVYCYRRDNEASAMTCFKYPKAEMALRAINIIRQHLAVSNEGLMKACDFADWHTHGDMYNWMVLAKAKGDYPNFYGECCKKVWSYAPYAMFAPINKKERFRAFVQCIHPRILALLLELRRWKSIIKTQ